MDRRRGLITGLVGALVLVAGGGPKLAVRVGAADLGTRPITPSHPVASWDGASTAVNVKGNGSPAQQTCTPSTCDVVRVDVEMPPGSFPTAADGVLVSVKWTNDFDQWNLYVDGPDGLPAGRGVDIITNAQSVLLTQPSNGVYVVHVVPFQTTLPEDVHYAGEARVYTERETRAAPGTRLLPRLQTVAPYDFHIGDVPPIPSNPSGWRWTPDGSFASSCYVDEQTEQGARRCLRFSNDIRNVGDGPLRLRFRYDEGFGARCSMEQEILVAGAPPVDRNAGPCIFHPQHAHFHYQNMAQYLLYPVGVGGRPGTRPVGASRKLGYCLVDVDDHTFGSARTRPRAYAVPTSCVPNSIPARQPGVWDYMGISAGWGDVYTWDLPVQYIDIGDLGDGVYEVVSRANPDGGVVESAPGLETGVTCIRITGDGVRVVREFPSQGNTAPLPDCPGAA